MVLSRFMSIHDSCRVLSFIHVHIHTKSSTEEFSVEHLMCNDCVFLESLEFYLNIFLPFKSISFFCATLTVCWALNVAKGR